MANTVSTSISGRPHTNYRVGVITLLIHNLFTEGYFSITTLIYSRKGNGSWNRLITFHTYILRQGLHKNRSHRVHNAEGGRGAATVAALITSRKGNRSTARSTAIITQSAKIMSPSYNTT